MNLRKCYEEITHTKNLREKCDFETTSEKRRKRLRRS